MFSYFKKNTPLLSCIAIYLIFPLIDNSLNLGLLTHIKVIAIFTILALGLNLITGLTGMLNLGIGGFMAIGAYTYSILTANLYPFQFNFTISCICAVLFGAFIAKVISVPILRLRGDYFAIVTLGLGEIIQDSLKNLEAITQGTQGISPTLQPSENPLTNYYVYVLAMALIAILSKNLKDSDYGRALKGVKNDEIVMSALGYRNDIIKSESFILGSAIAALSGALFASNLNSSGDPGNYDFQVSIIALSSIILGGMGSIVGTIFGTFIIVGLNRIVLAEISNFLVSKELTTSGSFLSTPDNWKFFVFGLVLVLSMRFNPKGLFKE